MQVVCVCVRGCVGPVVRGATCRATYKQWHSNDSCKIIFFYCCGILCPQSVTTPYCKQIFFINKHILTSTKFTKMPHTKSPKPYKQIKHVVKPIRNVVKPEIKLWNFWYNEWVESNFSKSVNYYTGPFECMRVVKSEVIGFASNYVFPAIQKGYITMSDKNKIRIIEMPDDNDMDQEVTILLDTGKIIDMMHVYLDPEVFKDHWVAMGKYGWNTAVIYMEQLERTQRELDEARERKRYYKLKYREEKNKRRKPNLRIQIPTSPVQRLPSLTPTYMGDSPQIENYPEKIELFPHNECGTDPIAPEGYEYVMDIISPEFCSPRFGYKLTKK